ncbi:type IX secretion system membrane protein, PorP/SprF family [Halpernia humi]|uniref:Type IX secretion system membrane protein, PorP/SprF family n=1 Tax=Halpernia humi TaxID=493375 RepID=A0A1H6BL57_9FLAO|nr:PorP/SprF family type IX secretion system membrane protein [Halpernia humi]SEG61403.1 type IX secretion system membrane protein, PorP/SprF family [Halpernia humi]
MKKVYIFFVVIISGFAMAQETLPIYQQYLLDGQFLINPAFYGATDDVVVNGNYQKQFSKLSESPNVQSVGIHANIFDRVGAGISFFRDQNGPISSNGITAGASYFIPLSDDGERKDQFSFGTNVNFYNMNFDYGALNPQDPNDPLLYEGNNNIFIVYANLGMQATYKNFFGGVSILDIPLTNDIPIVNGIEPSPTKYILNAGYDYVLTEGFSLEPSVLVNLNTNSSKLIDYNILAKIYNETNMFAAGVSFRSAKDNIGSQQLSFSPIIKAKLNKFTFGATYNMGLSDIQTYGGSSFMLSIGYNFDNFINTRGFRYR